MEIFSLLLGNIQSDRSYDILEPHADARFEITGMVVPSVENFSDDNPHF